MTELLILADGPGYAGLFADFNTTFWSAVLRIVQAMFAAAPFLVAGVFAAGILRGMVGADRTRRILGEGHWSGPLRAWGLGILLPICSLGALPVARELRRAGVSSGTVISFVLVAPVLNPVSIIYGLSHIDPVMLGYFAIGTFAVSVGIGTIWNRVISSARDTPPEELERAPRDAVARLKVTGHTAARVLVGPAAVDYGLALLAVGFLGAFLPHASMQTGLTRDNPFAPLLMGIVAIPCYVTPTDVMMHFGHIVQDGYSLGAAFALIVLGAGANVGVANWIRRDYGVRAVSFFVAMLIGSTLVIGLTADRAIVNGNATVKDHTHAFDSFTRLAAVPDEQANVGWVAAKVWEKIRERTDVIAGMVLLLVLALAGTVLWWLGDRADIEHLLHRSTDAESEALTTPDWNPALTPVQLALAGAVCAIGLAAVGLFLFYPSPIDLLEDASDVRVDAYEAAREGDLTELRRRLDQWRALVEKLPTSRWIRGGTVTPEQREAVDELLYGLDTFEESVVAGSGREVRAMRTFVEQLNRTLNRAFRDAAG